MSLLGAFTENEGIIENIKKGQGAKKEVAEKGAGREKCRVTGGNE